MSTAIGKPLSRVDGREKVTGQARYAAEFNVPDLAYGVVVSSTIAKGTITRLDARPALNVPGVLAVFSHENRPSLPWLDLKYKDQDAPGGSPFRPFYKNEIRFSGQPVALVVAETFELARYAARLVDIEYAPEEAQTNLETQLEEARKPSPSVANIFKPLPPKPRGTFETAFRAAPKRVANEYVHPAEHHNPMELFATTVHVHPDGKLTVYDKTQGVTNSLMYATQVFGISSDDIRILSPYVGGGFGSGLRPQYQLFMALLAATELKRSVRVSLTRQQMFTFGHRPATVQRVALGAKEDGTLDALFHEAIAATSTFEDYTETVVNWSAMLYPAQNVTLRYKLAPLDICTPLDMRAPGGATGLHAIESAIDDLAYKLRMDPLEFRLKNYAERDEAEDRPFSSKELRKCFLQGAAQFGWGNRPLEPRSMRRGNVLVGWGVATGMWEANQIVARAEAVLGVNGKLRVSSATADIGTGTYTVMTQIAADCLGLPVEDVLFRLGDSDLPFAPIQGGSWTAATVGSAVKAACEELGKTLYKLAKKVPNSPLTGTRWDDVVFADRHIRLKSDPAVGVSLLEVVAQNGGRALRETATGVPNALKQKNYTRSTHAANFVEVEVDEDYGTVRVTRVVTAVAGGRILNPKTARSQILGGVIWGVSKSLHEESVLDHRYGRFMNHNLAEYHIPVCNDSPDIEVIFVEEHDEIVNPLGVKGLGEIGIVGIPPAVANAVFHATGKRINDLPLTLDKVM
jgi:xanthine dehydrogenase YagR molybdenum-binding subunit